MEDMFGLSGKTAIVWGGGQGLGAASARRLARAGCDIAVVDYVCERAEQIADEIHDLGRRAVALKADATNEGEVEAAVASAESALAPVDVMVAVVGMATWKPLLQVNADDWSRDFAVNLNSFLYTSRAVARSLGRTGRSGAIVGIASVSGLVSAPLHAPYGAAKAALVHLVRSMAVEWGPAVRVNAVAPGVIETPRVAATTERVTAVRSRIPTKRMGTADEVAKTVLFLVSDLASYVTGHTLAADGGWTSAFLMDPTLGLDIPRTI
jgi:NAD(P)-dependent dehydrogenase (short-subunit alcohol dehydrogenase family)